MLNNNLSIEGFTPEDREWFQANGEEKLVLQNEKIIDGGKTPYEICLVLKGLFALTSKNGEQISTIGPGGILGAVTFLSQTIASASVVAVETDNVVFAIPRKVIAAHLTHDLEFAARFYRVTSIFLSNQLKKITNSFITHPKTQKAKNPVFLGPVPLFRDDQPDFNLIHHQLVSCPSAASIFRGMQKGENDYSAFRQREHQLSVSTVSAESLQLLWEIGREEGIDHLDELVIHHQPSITAAEKQTILSDYLIQKTVTILIGNRFVLCSSMGDLKIRRKLLKQIAAKLDLPRGTLDSYINPAVFVPEIELGLMRGMVSTFFSPRRITQLSFVSLIVPSANQVKNIAISLSPFESLILPCDLFPKIVKKYAERAYPYLPFELLSD